MYVNMQNNGYRCGICKYSQPSSKESYVYCHRFPPTLSEDSGWIMPHVPKQMVCGEFKSEWQSSK